MSDELLNKNSIFESMGNYRSNHKEFNLVEPESAYFISLDNEHKKKLHKIKNMWSDRLQGCPK